MSLVRVGAVGYLNARPLVEGLDLQPDRFSVRFDVPSRCAALLLDHQVDLGLVPSIEYLSDPAYRIVPDIAVASHGAVKSVALFVCRPLAAIRSVALDSGSRTSVGLLRVLCAERFGIDPAFVTREPDLRAMLTECDAALLIGDVALFVDHQALGADKIDLGEEWTAMTGLPFVYALWVGRPGAVDARDIGRLKTARDLGRASAGEISARYFVGEPEKVRRGAEYLRDNIRYDLGDQERAGLERFFELARARGLLHGRTDVRFYDRDER